MNKTFIAAAATIIAVGGGMFATQTAFAQSADTVTNTAPMASLVQRISTKFGLKSEDVQAVFDQEMQERHAQHQANETARLDKLVTDGKLTDAQKQLILTKREEMKTQMKANMESLKNKTPEERKVAMEAHHKSLEEWATQNNIDVQYIMPHGPVGARRGHKGFGRGEMILVGSEMSFVPKSE